MDPTFFLRRQLAAILLALPVLLSFTLPVAAQDRTAQEPTHIFFSAGCADCWPYVENVLIPALQARGAALDPRIHDYTAPDERRLLLKIADSVQLPRSIADSLYAFVPTDKGTLVILGHVPPNLIDTALSAPNRPPRLVMWQPEMHGVPSEYRLWAWRGEVETFPIDTPFQEALARAMVSTGPLPIGPVINVVLIPPVALLAVDAGLSPALIQRCLLHQQLLLPAMCRLAQDQG